MINKVAKTLCESSHHHLFGCFTVFKALVSLSIVVNDIVSNCIIGTVSKLKYQCSFSDGLWVLPFV